MIPGEMYAEWNRRLIPQGYDQYYLFYIRRGGGENREEGEEGYLDEKSEQHPTL